MGRGPQKAFTLAEVLITLAIIGVVAALTIPTVVRNYKDRQFKTAYQKAYSELSQAVTMGITNNEFPYRESDYVSAATEKEWEVTKNI